MFEAFEKLKSLQGRIDAGTMRKLNAQAEIDNAVARSNSAVGGRVIHQGNAEYLIRSVGWVRNLRDIEDTVVTQRGGTPITVKQLGVTAAAAPACPDAPRAQADHRE